MSAKLEKPLKRLVTIPGVTKDVTVTVHPGGIEMVLPGHRKRIWSSWETIVKNMTTPTDVPSHLYQNPLKLLQHQAKD